MDSNCSQAIINGALARNTQVKSLRLRNFTCRCVLFQFGGAIHSRFSLTGLRS
jgi:hypothetical protein